MNELRPGTEKMLTVDVEKYQHFLDDADLSEAQKEEVLRALWSIICNFVELGYGVHPLQQAGNASPESACSLSCEHTAEKKYKNRQVELQPPQPEG